MNNRVILCEVSEIISTGLSEIVQNMARFDVVSRLDSPDRLNEKIIATDANMLIINPSLLGYSDRNLPSQLHKEHPNLAIVALVTTYTDNARLKGYDSVIGINDPKLNVTVKLNEVVKDNDRQDKTSDDVELSKREVDVLIAVAKGMMNKEIADQMNISIHTVISHRKNITRKTGIKSVSGLTVYALINNLIDENEVYK